MHFLEAKTGKGLPGFHNLDDVRSILCMNDDQTEWNIVAKDGEELTVFGTYAEIRAQLNEFLAI